MTLDVLGRNGKPFTSASWTIDDHDVVLQFEKPATFFNDLIRESFKIDKDGLVWFPALGLPEDNPQASAFLNECLLSTFLQHGKSRKSDSPRKPTGIKVVTIDEIEYPVHYRKVVWYAHQKVKIKTINQAQRLVGWIYPGGAVRHEAFNKETGLREPLDLFLPLIYSIVGVLYFMIRKRGGGTKYAVVIPDVADLRKYAVFRRQFVGMKENDLTVSGSGEAALRTLAALKAENMMDAVGSTACRVMTFGKVKWDKQQKKRVEAYDVFKENSTALEVYQRCMQFFSPRLVKPKAGAPFWVYPQTPELIAENLLRKRPWWSEFSEFISHKEIRDHVLGTNRYKGERENLSRMISDTRLEGAEHVFVKACQEAWRRRLGKLGENARRDKVDPSRLFQREFERVRISFSRCKNAATMREAVTDFWARSGPLSSLQSDWRDALGLLNSDWRLAKDLCLLALASYAPKKEEE